MAILLADDKIIQTDYIEEIEMVTDKSCTIWFVSGKRESLHFSTKEERDGFIVELSVSMGNKK